MDVNPRVRPGEHAGGLVLVEELQADEQPEHGAAERLRQSRGLVGGPGYDGPVGPAAAVGDEQMQMRMPVGPGAVRLQAGHDADGEVALAGDRLQAMQMVRYQPKQRRRLRVPGLVDATRRRYRLGPARSGTGERRAYSRLGRRSSPCRCARGHADARSGRPGFTMLAVAERTDQPRHVTDRAVRSQQKPAFA